MHLLKDFLQIIIVMNVRNSLINSKTSIIQEQAEAGATVASIERNIERLNNDVAPANQEIESFEQKLQEAEKKLNNWRLEECVMYVTLEPCPMCAAAIVSSRINKVYFGAYDTIYGALGSVIDLRKLSNSDLKVYGGIMEDECKNLLDEYFEKMRRRDERK